MEGDTSANRNFLVKVALFTSNKLDFYTLEWSSKTIKFTSSGCNAPQKKPKWENHEGLKAQSKVCEVFCLPHRMSLKIYTRTRIKNVIRERVYL